MRQVTKYIKTLLFFAFASAGLVSCYDVNEERELCDYKVQLRYDYNEENGTTENMILYYVFSMDEYIFDADGILYLSRTFTPDRCTEYLHSELDLPPGQYSVIGIGNRDERSVITDVRTGLAPQAGVTHRDDMRMSLDHAAVMTGNTRGPSEPLYHGYRSFTVNERGISRVRVDMINAHFTLQFRVRWRYNAPARGNYYALLESIPSEYSLMPEYIYPAGSFQCEDYDSNWHDEYPSNSNSVIHHIPHTTHRQANVLTHRHDTYMNTNRQIWGEFMNYRIKTATRPVLRIMQEGTNSQVVKDIDLQAYFAWYNNKLNHELKQAYIIDIYIDGTTVIISPLDVADWDEGGDLGGS